MNSLSPKDIYCYTRAADLQEQYNYRWSKCYTQAEEEYSRLSNLTNPLDYDDDINDLEVSIE